MASDFLFTYVQYSTVYCPSVIPDMALVATFVCLIKRMNCSFNTYRDTLLMRCQPLKKIIYEVTYRVLVWSWRLTFYRGMICMFAPEYHPPGKQPHHGILVFILEFMTTITTNWSRLCEEARSILDGPAYRGVFLKQGVFLYLRDGHRKSNKQGLLVRVQSEPVIYLFVCFFLQYVFPWMAYLSMYTSVHDNDSNKQIKALWRNGSALLCY